MKLHYCAISILLFGLLTACEEKDEKPEPSEPEWDAPCFGSFSCEVNGKPFKSYQTGGSCYSENILYGGVQSVLHVSGFDCRVDSNGVLMIGFEVHGVEDTGVYTIHFANCGYLNNRGQPISYNIELGGELHVTGLIKDGYSEDYTGGYVEGTFWFTTYSNETTDTMYVTNGKFCGRI